MAGQESFLQLGGKVVIVTGASAGIGEATALEFARQGCLLMLCGRNKERLNGVASKCAEISGQKVETTLGDLIEDSVQEEIVHNTIQHFGCIDILVNNAGMNLIVEMSDTTRSQWDTIMKTNLESVFFLTQKAVPHLLKTKGSIVNVSSIASECQLHKCAVYSMAKAALDSYTKCLAIELAPKGVRVNAVNPGTVLTLVNHRGENAFSDEKMAKFAAAMSSNEIHPLGRVTEPHEVADSIVFLASTRSSNITGEMLFVAGGRQVAYPQAKFASPKQ